MSKTRSKTRKGAARTSKRASIKTLVREGYAIDAELARAEKREIAKAERAAIADYKAELRYAGLKAILRTWKMPRFRKLVRLPKVKTYVRGLSARMEAMTATRKWLAA